VLHTTGGYMVGAYVTTKYVFDLKDEDVYWCTADVGWVTGHSYIVYGPLCERRDVPDVRGRPELPRLGPLLAHHRAHRRHHPLHRAHGDPRLHEVGRRSGR
jgi:acetyl-CoA synthetase